MILKSILFILVSFFCYKAFAQIGRERQILWTTDWSSNQKFIAVGGNIDSLKMYHASNLQTYKSFPIGNTITCVKWHPFKNILAVGTQTSKDKVRIINFESEKVIELHGISPEGARGIDWNFTGEYLAVGDNDGQISIFDINGNSIRRIQQENTKSITSIDWHPNKNIFITVCDKIRTYDLNGALLNAIIHRKERILLLCVAWHNSGQFFVTGDYGDNQNKYKPLLQFWNANGILLKSISISKGEYRNLSWNSNGNRLASASDALRIWDKEGNLISTGSSKDYLWGVSWNKKGSRIITSSIAQRIILWDNKAKKIIIKE